MTDLFLYGTLRHLPLLEVVLGRQREVRNARLSGFDVRAVRIGSFPVIVEDASQAIDGVLVTGLTTEELARVDYYEAVFGYRLRDCKVLAGGRELSAQVYFAFKDGSEARDRWVLEDWEPEWADITVQAAREFMDGFGKVSAEDTGMRYPQMMSRAATRVRAAGEQTANDVRLGPDRSGVKTQTWRRPYSNFFVLEEHELKFARFDGSLSETATRAALVGGDAVTVLPYDPVLDRVMMVEQFRVGPFIRGDKYAWTMEPIAGRIDPGEAPEEAARREMIEEAGLEVAEMLPLPSYYPSPGAYTEYLFNFVGIAKLPDSAAGLGGLAGEGEDIKSHVLQFDAAMELISSGEVNTGPLILSLLWLQGQRDLIRLGIDRGA